MALEDRAATLTPSVDTDDGGRGGGGTWVSGLVKTWVELTTCEIPAATLASRAADFRSGEACTTLEMGGIGGGALTEVDESVAIPESPVGYLAGGMTEPILDAGNPSIRLTPTFSRGLKPPGIPILD